MTTCPGALSLATTQTSSPPVSLVAASAASARAASTSSPISAAIAPSPTGTACCIAWPRRIGERQRVCRGECGVLAERMSCDITEVAAKLETALRLDDAQRRHADGQQRRLGIFGQRQIAFRAFKHQARQMLRQRVVDLLEEIARIGKGLGEAFAHAHRLRPLTRKYESAFHTERVLYFCCCRPLRRETERRTPLPAGGHSGGGAGVKYPAGISGRRRGASCTG